MEAQGKMQVRGAEHLKALVLLAQDLGETALRLTKDTERLYDRIAAMGMEDSIAEPGHYYHVTSWLTEDYMDVEVYDSGTDSYDPPSWQRLLPGEFEGRASLKRDTGMRKVNGRNDWVFIGHRINYDPEAKKLWIYDESSHTRVNYRKGIVIEDGVLGGPNPGVQRRQSHVPNVMIN